MKKHSIHMVLYLTFLSGFLSCEQAFDLDIKALDQVMVLDGIVETDSIFRVQLTLSQTPTKENISLLENAQVMITSANGAISLEWLDRSEATGSDFQQYYFATNMEKPLPGQSYTIHVSHSGYTSIQATTTVPQPVRFTDVKFNSDLIEVEYDESSQQALIKVWVEFDDPMDKNFYEIVAFAESEWEGASFYSQYSVFSKDPALNSHAMDISGGDDDTPYQQETLVFTDDLFNGKVYQAELLVALASRRYEGDRFYPISSLGNAPFHIQIRSISEEYYLYRETLKYYWKNRHNSFISPINVHSNVENGLGIFASYSTHSQMITPSNPDDFR